MASFVEPGAWGPDFTRLLEAYERTAGCWLVGEDMPQESNAVTLNSTSWTSTVLPAANVHFDDHSNDIAMREHAYSQAQKLYRAVGAVSTHRTTPYPSTHNLGTCRMSEARRRCCRQVGQGA